ncbi:MAG: RES domain-containing protein, partial [Verrucomicrobia bacterium]|nr:RES domain-containing protein [Verrucomicrobiota bacterium]
LVRQARASDAFKGEGAKRFGGRWNPKSIPAIYGSEHLSLAVLELRVNQAGYDPEDQYVYFQFGFDEALVELVETPPSDWLTGLRQDGSITAAQAFGEEWFLQERSAILSVPSAVIRIERNFVLNPRHAHFHKVAISDGVKIGFDPRLWNTA